MTENKVSTINLFIKYLEDTPINKIKPNENLYFTLKNKINNYLNEHKNITTEEIKSIIKLYCYPLTDKNAPSLTNTISIITLIITIISLAFFLKVEKFAVLPYIFIIALEFIGILTFINICFIIRFQYMFKRKYKIFYTCLSILDEI